MTTILNFAPAIATKDRNLFNDVDYLILNEVEAHQLSGLEIKTVENATNAALSIIDNFKVQIGVIVTLGEMGVVYVNKLTRSSFHKQSKKVKVVDTTVIKTKNFNGFISLNFFKFSKLKKGRG